MTDQELLELAANAVGIELDWDVPDGASPWVITGEGADRGPGSPWDPLNDDGDALRLAFMLGMKVDIAKREVWYCKTPAFGKWLSIGWDGGIEGLRRAIVLAAAEMGENTHA